jgi:hypothetical protein
MAHEIPNAPLPSFGRVSGAGFLAGVVAWIVVTGGYLLGQQAGLALKMQVSGMGGTGITEIPLLAFIGATIVPGLVAGLIGAILRRRPLGVQMLWITGGAVLVLSLLWPINSPLVQPAEVPMSDRVFMAALHVFVYLIIVGWTTRAMRVRQI